MAQNITLLGASYSDVPAVELPKTGGGTAKFMDTSDANAAAADIAQGKTAYVNGEKVTGTGSGGGGGASNVVTGTFKGTTTGAAMDVTLNYTGSGYPIAVLITPKGGYLGNTTYADTIQKSTVGIFMGIKPYMDLQPTYESTTNDGNYLSIYTRYKSSSSSATSYSGTSQHGNTTTFNGTDPSATVNTCVRFKSNTKMSVYIASSSYGFMANVEYTYIVIYSS